MNNADALAHEHLKASCTFLADYAARLMGCGATCIRIEKNVRRMAEALGVVAELTIMPANVMLTCRSIGEDCLPEVSHTYTCNVKVRPACVSFFLNTQLSKLSWRISEGAIGMAQAVKEMNRLGDGKSTGRWTMLLLTSLANLSFCELFGGDVAAMIIVFVATLGGFGLKQVMLADGFDFRATTLCSAFFASVIGSAGHVFGISGTPEVALGTSVLYLIPGIPYLNSLSDMIDGHYLVAFARFMHAAILTVCISLGLCGGLMLMNLKWMF